MRSCRQIGMVMAVALLLGGLAATAGAQDKDQKKREAQLRTVHGVVVDREENPVASAIVYLKNLKTLAVRTYISDDSAHYRFSGLDPNVDYEIHAEHEEMTSANRTISSFDNRKDIDVSLKLVKKKSGK